MTTYRQNPAAPATVLSGEAALVTPADSRLHILNDVATLVWELCDGEGKTLDGLVAALCDTFDVDEEVARAEVEAFLKDGVARGFLLTD